LGTFQFLQKRKRVGCMFTCTMFGQAPFRFQNRQNPRITIAQYDHPLASAAK
jgi:hypothetical protein